MAKVGAIVGIIGAALLIVAGILTLSTLAAANVILENYGYEWSDFGINPTMWYVSLLVTLALGAIGLVGAILSFKDIKAGNILMIAAGTVATIGLFIPISTGTYSIYSFVIPLTTSLFYADPIILMVGGILGLAIKSD